MKKVLLIARFLFSLFTYFLIHLFSNSLTFLIHFYMNWLYIGNRNRILQNNSLQQCGNKFFKVVNFFFQMKMWWFISGVAEYTCNNIWYSSHGIAMGQALDQARKPSSALALLKSNFPLIWSWEMKSSYFPPTFEFWNWDSAWKRLLKWSHLNSRRFSNSGFV